MRKLVIALALCSVACCGAAAGKGAPGDTHAKERPVDQLDIKASDAIASGEAGVRAFLDAAMSSDWQATGRWINKDDLPLEVFLPVAEVASYTGRVALLSPSRQRVVADYLALQHALTDQPAGPGRPGAPPAADMGDDRVGIDVLRDATRYVLTSVTPSKITDGAMRLLVERHLARAAQLPGLDPQVAQAFARGLLQEIDPARVVRGYGPRMIPMLVDALRAKPAASDALRRLARSFRGVEPSGTTDAAVADELERWWRDEGPYLTLDLGALPPAPPRKPWFVVDDYARFAGLTGAVVGADDPARQKWNALAADQRRALADDSAKRRRDDFEAWRKWVQTQRGTLGLD
jgi:hypothetical protein